jgi:hypothetical protein
MIIRTFFLLCSLCLLLSISAYQASQKCQGSWTRHAHTLSIPEGFGVNIHFTDPKPGEMEMIAAAGFRWVRMDFKWDTTEFAPGRYDFAAYDRLMVALERNGLRAFFILDYGNPLYDNGAPPRTDIARQAFARWAVAAAKHFTGRNIIWEIYNEPNIQLFWPPKPKVDEYIPLALAVGRAFRANVPNEKLIGPATSGIDFVFLEACFKAGLLEYWSAVSVHPYYRSDPEVAADEYCRLREMIARYGPSKQIPIVSGEWGYSSVWRGLSEEKQAEMLARELLTNVANDIPISIWYDWHDDGSDETEAEHNFGLVHHEYQAGRDQIYEPKAAYLAAKTLNSFFNGYSFEKRLPVGSSYDYVLVFSRAGDQRIAAWTTSSRTQRITIPTARGSFAATKYTGADAGEVTANHAGVTVEISRAPIYLTRRK